MILGHNPVPQQSVSQGMEVIMFNQAMAFLTLSLSFPLLAQNGIFHFETSLGVEITGFAQESNYDDIDITLLARDGVDANALTIEYVKAAIERRTYYYTADECTETGCTGLPENINTGQEKEISRKNYEYHHLPNVTFEKLSIIFASRNPDKLVTSWLQDKDLLNSPLNILSYNDAGVPTALCVMTSKGCVAFDKNKLAFEAMENGWKATYAPAIPGEADFHENKKISRALNRYIKFFRIYQGLDCNTLYTGLPALAKPQLVCVIKEITK